MLLSNRRQKLVLACILFFNASLAIATLQSAGSGCANLSAGSGNFTVSYSLAVPAGRGVMVALATSQNAPLGTVTDSQGNQYPGTVTRFNVTGLVFNRVAQIVTPLAIGNTISFPFTLIPVGGMAACAQIYTSSDMLLPVVVDQTGSDAGTSNTISASLAAPTLGAQTVLHGASFTLADEGMAFIDPTYNPNLRFCSSGNTICLISGVREVSAASSYSFGANLSNVRDWGAVIAAYRRILPDAIFASGFE